MLPIQVKQFNIGVPGRRLSSYTLNSTKEYKDQHNPLDHETEHLATITGFSRHRVEETLPLTLTLALIGGEG